MLQLACSVTIAATADRAACDALHTCNWRHSYPICVGQVGVVLHECALHACIINLSAKAVQLVPNLAASVHIH